jgi:hypothetical protein
MCMNFRTSAWGHVLIPSKPSKKFRVRLAGVRGGALAGGGPDHRRPLTSRGEHNNEPAAHADRRMALVPVRPCPQPIASRPRAQHDGALVHRC